MAGQLPSTGTNDYSTTPRTIVNAKAVITDYAQSLPYDKTVTGLTTAALLGNNLKQIKLEVPAGSHLNGEGEMCDRWGTPYFFHQVSATEMEIRSAGPDRKMWTGDDSQM
jgi:hypothetical protein